MTHNNTKNNYGFALLIIGCLFFVFGFITWANSQLIPYLRIACELTKTESYFVGTAFFAAYFVMSLPSSYILKKVGFKRGMAVGLFVMAIGALLFIPAAKQRNYPLFLTGLFIIGTGLALLQTASNPYVTILGPSETAARRMSIMGICNKLAGICAVYILGSIMLGDIDALQKSIEDLPNAEKQISLQGLADKVIQPYIIIASAFFILGLILLFIKLPEVEEEESTDGLDNITSEDAVIFNNSLHVKSDTKYVFQHRNLVLGAIAIFFYVGVEVISYDAFSTMGKTLGFGEKVSASFASYTGYAMLAGYLLSIVLIPTIINQRKALIISTLLSCVLLLAALFTSGWTSVVLFALLGFSESVMWPAIWPLALHDLGKHTKIGSALLVMMIVGGAVMLPLMGAFADLIHSAKWGFLMMIPCYLYILFFALNGYKTRS